MPEYFKVALASELEPNHGKLVEVQGKKIALFNLDGKFHASPPALQGMGSYKVRVNGPDIELEV